MSDEEDDDVFQEANEQEDNIDSFGSRTLPDNETLAGDRQLQNQCTQLQLNVLLALLRDDSQSLPAVTALSNWVEKVSSEQQKLVSEWLLVNVYTDLSYTLFMIQRSLIRCLMLLKRFKPFELHKETSFPDNKSMSESHGLQLLMVFFVQGWLPNTTMLFIDVIQAMLQVLLRKGNIQSIPSNESYRLTPLPSLSAVVDTLGHASTVDTRLQSNDRHRWVQSVLVPIYLSPEPDWKKNWQLVWQQNRQWPEDWMLRVQKFFEDQDRFDQSGFIHSCAGGPSCFRLLQHQLLATRKNNALSSKAGISPLLAEQYQLVID